MAALTVLAVFAGSGSAAAAQAPRNTSEPTISGATQEGLGLAADPGSWTGTQPIGFHYQWRRCTREGRGCANIPGATGRTYTLAGADVGHRLDVFVTATNNDGTGTAHSTPTDVVTARPSGAPRNTSEPTVSGRTQQGMTLTADPGGWTGAQPIRFHYQWRRCTREGRGCANIPGATDRRYTLQAADVGRRLDVFVTATNDEAAGTAHSRPTDLVAPPPGAAPTTSSQPRIIGTPRQGELLTAQANTWTGTQPIQLSYRWRRCDANGGNCIEAGDARVYRLGPADVGHTMRLVVLARNNAGSGSAVSDPTPVVQPAAPPPPPSGCTPVSSVSLPDQLVVDRIQYNPRVITSRSQPLVARFHVATTKGRCVSGALVYAVGVPFDRLSKAPETPTDGNGFATVTFRILPTFVLRRGNLVVIFVRARKPGDSLLAGVSTRRLVSVRVG